MNRLVKRIVIKGGYGRGNFGDDALMLAVHKVVRNVATTDDIGYLCTPAAYLRTLLPDAAVLTLDQKDFLGVSLLLFGGGTQFYSFPLSSRGRHALLAHVIQAAQPPHLLPLKVARRILRGRWKSVPDHSDAVGALGVGVGPFVAGSAQETQTRELFAHMAYVSVRDVQSYQIGREWGVRNLHHHADLCFWPDFYRAYLPEPVATAKHSVDRIGLIVRDWPHDQKGDSYHQSLMTVAKGLTRAGKVVDFILLAGRHDRVWLKRLKAAQFHTVTWNPAENSIADFVRTLASYDLFLTARYHGSVLATLLEKPSICVGIERKLELFADVLGAAGRCWKYPFDATDCMRLITDTEADYRRVVDHVQRVKQQQSERATRMVDSFLAFARPNLGQTDLGWRNDEGPGLHTDSQLV